MEIKNFYKLKKYDVADIIKVGCSICLFVLLVILSVQGGKRWYVALSLSLGLFIVFEANSFFIKNLAVKAVFYAVEYVILLVYSLMFSMPFLSTLYSLILVDFYMNNTLKGNCVFGGLSFVAYAVSIGVRDYIFAPAAFDFSVLLGHRYQRVYRFHAGVHHRKHAERDHQKEQGSGKKSAGSGGTRKKTAGSL